MSEFRYETISERQLAALVAAHLRLYNNRLLRAQNGAQGIHVDECLKLANIWSRVAVNLQQGNWRLRLSKNEITEIMQAIDSGDYDTLLGENREPSS